MLLLLPPGQYPVGGPWITPFGVATFMLGGVWGGVSVPTSGNPAAADEDALDVEPEEELGL